MNADDFGALASAILSDEQLCQQLRMAADEVEFWSCLEVLARERNLHPDFELMGSAARGSLSFWFGYWSGDGVS